MADKAEASFAKDYRNARGGFIAACERAHADSIARVHPHALGPDGKPLFIDSVAFGSRDAVTALLVLTGRDGASGLLGAHFLNLVLESRVLPRSGTRMVLVHALNPFGFAWGRRANEEGLELDDPAAKGSWSYAMLKAIATEDLAHIGKLKLLEVDKGRRNGIEDAAERGPARALKEFKPGIGLNAARLTLQPDLAAALAARVVTRALATL